MIDRKGGERRETRREGRESRKGKGGNSEAGKWRERGGRGEEERGKLLLWSSMT